jgi:hypothetical protein
MIPAIALSPFSATSHQRTCRVRDVNCVHRIAFLAGVNLLIASRLSECQHF